MDNEAETLSEELKKAFIPINYKAWEGKTIKSIDSKKTFFAKMTICKNCGKEVTSIVFGKKENEIVLSKCKNCGYLFIPKLAWHDEVRASNVYWAQKEINPDFEYKDKPAKYK